MLKIQKSWPVPRIISTPTATLPQKGSLPLWHTAHQATPWTPTLTPHKDAFLHHLWGGVAQYSIVSGVTQTNESEWLGEKEAEPYSRPAHFLSWVAGSGDIVHRPDYTPNHQRNPLGTLHHRIVGISMANGTRHDPCIPRHWAMGCPAWTLTRTSHNRVVYKIRPNTDVASISSVLHLVWPLAQGLSSMVVPTRSKKLQLA